MVHDAQTNALALLMIASVRAALKNGVRHYDLQNKLLATELEITEALLRDGRVTLDASDRVERTTEVAELALVRAEFGTRKGTA